MQPYARQEVCSHLDRASAWGIGGVKTPENNDSAEPWLCLFGPIRNPTQHLMDWYWDCLIF